MLRHIVMHRYKDTASADDLVALKAAVESFSEHPLVRSLTCGTNVGKGPNHFDFVMVADFDDADALGDYIQSDMHKTYVCEHAKHVATLSVIQHEL